MSEPVGMDDAEHRLISHFLQPGDRVTAATLGLVRAYRDEVLRQAEAAPAVVEHEGVHIRKWDMRMVRNTWLLAGPPIGPVQLVLDAEFDDETCAEEAAAAISGLLKLKGWAK